MADTIITATIIKSTEKAFQFSIKYWCSTNGGIKTMTRWIPKFACKDNGDGTFSVWGKFIDEITKEFKSKYYSTPKFDLNAFEVEKKFNDDTNARNKAHDKAYNKLTKELTKDMPTIIKEFLVDCGNRYTQIINVYSHLTGHTPFNQSKLPEVREWLKKYGISGKGYEYYFAMSERDAFHAIIKELDCFDYARNSDGDYFLTMNDHLFNTLKEYYSKYPELPRQEVVYIIRSILGNTQASGEFFDFAHDIYTLNSVALETYKLLSGDIVGRGHFHLVESHHTPENCIYASKFAGGVA